MSKCAGRIFELQAKKALRKKEQKENAERYLFLRDVGSATWVPFCRQWNMTAQECDATIDKERAPREF